MTLPRTTADRIADAQRDLTTLEAWQRSDIGLIPIDTAAYAIVAASQRARDVLALGEIIKADTADIAAAARRIEEHEATIATQERQIARLREVVKTALCVVSAARDAQSWHANMLKDINLLIQGCRTIIEELDQ